VRSQACQVTENLILAGGKYGKHRCYNGLYRDNAQGFFNVPYGDYKHPAIYEENVLKAASNYLQLSLLETTEKVLVRSSFLFFLF
jgi:site-specific DNA-adenine methylase